MEILPKPSADEIKDIPVDLGNLLRAFDPGTPETRVVLSLMQARGYGRDAHERDKIIGRTADVTWTDVKAVTAFSDVQRIEEEQPGSVHEVQEAMVLHKYLAYCRTIGAIPDRKAYGNAVDTMGQELADHVNTLLAELK